MSRDLKRKQTRKMRTFELCFNMVATKRCAWGLCKNDSRYPHLMVKNKNGDPVHFVRFPAPKRFADKRRQWIVACHRGDSFVCSKDSYICSLHFVGENGPTLKHQDPVSAIYSKEKVRCFCNFTFVVIFVCCIKLDRLFWLGNAT